MAQQTLHKTDFQIRVKKGTRANLKLPVTELVGVQGEPAYTTDDKQLFVHDGTSFEPVQTLDMAMMFDNEIIGLDNEIVYNY